MTNSNNMITYHLTVDWRWWCNSVVSQPKVWRVK